MTLSLSIKSAIVLTIISLADTAAFAATSPKCPGETGIAFTNYKRRNPQEGGFVSDQADVDDDDNVFIAKTAAICGSSSLRDSVRIYGNAVIINSEIHGDARIYGDAVVKDNSEVYGKARIFDNAVITKSEVFGDDTTISGWYKATNARIGNGQLTAPQFTAEELAAQAAKLQAEKDAAAARLKAAGDKEEAKRLAIVKSKELRAKLEQIVNDYHIVGDERSNSYLKLAASADPCVLDFQNYSSRMDDSSYNLHSRAYIVKGVEYQHLEKFSHAKFKEVYLANNKANSKYHWATSGTFASEYTYLPSIILSRKEPEVDNEPVTGEKHYKYSGEHQTFFFVTEANRNEFFGVLSELYKTCP